MSDSILKTEEQVVEEFERLMEESTMNFDDIEIKLHKKPDIHAFLFLDRLVSKDYYKMIWDAEYEVIFLAVDLKDLVGCNIKVLEELYACGVFLSKQKHLAMLT